MADFELRKTFPYPLARVFAAYRDELEILPSYLPNIETIQVLERREPEPGVLEQVARWQAVEKGNLPRLAKPFVSKEILVWIDHATWRSAGHTCDWWFEFPAFPGGGVACKGHNWFEPTPDGGCRMVLTGGLTVDLAKIKGVPRLARGLGPRIEKLVLERVKPNLETTSEALQRLLSDSG
ncbi:MAG: DUF2505 family protein [bacterium]